MQPVRNYTFNYSMFRTVGTPINTTPTLSLTVVTPPLFGKNYYFLPASKCTWMFQGVWSPDFLLIKFEIMVQVTGYAIRKRNDGTTFISLEISGGLELVQSQETGKFYATIRKCSIPTTFDEETSKNLIGSKLEGKIVRVQCVPYEYTNKRTGEVMLLGYSYAYQPESSEAPVILGAFQEMAEM